MENDQISRRNFFKKVGIGGAGILLGQSVNRHWLHSAEKQSTLISHVYECKNGDPEQNVYKVIEMMGGIKQLIGSNDIVLLKPNAQWQNAATTNTNNMKGLIDLILNHPDDFTGEVIIVENNHYSNPRSQGGWATSARNGNYNLNELISYYNNNGHANVTGYALQDKDRGGKFVTGPMEGYGTVKTATIYTHSGTGRQARIHYMIFTSSYSGVTIDMKNGAWKNGVYTGQPVKFINLPVIYEHSIPGITSTIKNYLGVVDLTINWGGGDPYLNFHEIGDPDPSDGMAGAVGMYLNTIRHATLNVLSAEWVGDRDRLGTHTKTVIASKDPAALSYYAAKYLYYPLNSSPSLDPDNHNGRFGKFLRTFHAQGIGTININEIMVHKYDFDNPTIQRSDIDKKIRDLKEGKATEQEVKDLIEQYMQQG